jgi:hypothetical protein
MNILSQPLKDQAIVPNEGDRQLCACRLRGFSKAKSWSKYPSDQFTACTVSLCSPIGGESGLLQHRQLVDKWPPQP